MLVRNKMQLEHGPGQEEPWWDRHGSVQRQIDECLLQGAGRGGVRVAGKVGRYRYRRKDGGCSGPSRTGLSPTCGGRWLHQAPCNISVDTERSSSRVLGCTG